MRRGQYFASYLGETKCHLCSFQRASKEELSGGFYYSQDKWFLTFRDQGPVKVRSTYSTTHIEPLPLQRQFKAPSSSSRSCSNLSISTVPNRQPHSSSPFLLILPPCRPLTQPIQIQISKLPENSRKTGTQSSAPLNSPLNPPRWFSRP